MESLPDEVLCMIGQYLPTKDLISCVAVSCRWRDVFGCDQVWRSHCDEETEVYLKTTPCIVKPKFTSPEPDDTTLSPIGRWRTAYMREAHLWRNWMHGNYEEFKLKSRVNFVQFLNKDVVIITHGSKTACEVRDVSVEPSLLIAQLTTPNGEDCEVMVVRNNMFVARIEDTVQVIEVDFELRRLTFKHAWLVCPCSRFHIVDNAFVQVTTGDIHVWHLDCETKLKTEPCPIEKATFGDISVERQEDCDDVVVIANGKTGGYHCLIYNVTELRFLSFRKYFQNHSVRNNMRFVTVLVKNYIGLSTDTSFKVYDYHSSEMVYNIPITFTPICVLGDCFSFINVLRDLVLLCPSTGVRQRLHSNIREYVYLSEKIVKVRNRQGAKITKVGSEVAFENVASGKWFKVMDRMHSKCVHYETKGNAYCLYYW